MISHGIRLERVVSNLAGTLLEVVAGNIDQAALVTDVAIDEPREQAELQPGAVLLCTGADVEHLPGLIDRAVASQIPALVLRSPLNLPAELRATIERSGVVLLGLSAGATWTQLVVLLRSLLASSAGTEERVAGLQAEDTFALANAIGALLDAPITIEDRTSQVLAFSGRQDEADQARIEAILGRAVPQHNRQAQERAGVFKRLYSSEKPVFFDTPQILGAAGLPRVAIAIRAGNQVLGSIWVAVRNPLSPEKEQILVDAAKVVALQLLRDRVSSDVDRQVRADLIASALASGPAALGAIERLRLAQRTVAVLGLSLPGDTADESSSDQTRQQFLERTAQAFAFHLSVAAPGAVAALVGDVCYAIMPAMTRQGATNLLQMAQRVSKDFLDRTPNRAGGAVIGIGRSADSADPTELARSRNDVDRSMRVLKLGHGSRVALFTDLQMDALLLDIGDQLRNEGGLVDGPVARIRQYDSEHGTSLEEALELWLDSFGNALSASAALDLHRNTFRYRLRRAAQIAQINLNDPDERFAAMLEFRLSRRLRDVG
ncbi:hypothetical protein AL755_00095 (plasmid) [Arthrobacter sp. ERGS1:01]|nr:hypothetical protein AL755_00095 [Arthrobacter sp. ERGS1:01]